MKSLLYFLGATAIASASEKTIVTFDGAEGTSFNWYTSDDPVMVWKHTIFPLGNFRPQSFKQRALIFVLPPAYPPTEFVYHCQ